MDFGDDWWHQTTVVANGTMEEGVVYPRLIRDIRESSPHYIDWGEFDE